MREVVRSRALWASVGSISLAVVLLITLAPARDITHTVLGWLRVSPLEIETAADAVSAPTEPPAPTPTLAEVVELVGVEPTTTIQDATSADLADLPFQVAILDPSTDFTGTPTHSVTTFGTVTLTLDTADLAALLAPGFPSRRLARRLEPDDVTVAGGAMVVSTWAAADDEEPLTLIQIEAPLVSGLPPRDLELLAELLAQALVPPILSQQFDVLDLPLVQLALGLEIDAESDSDVPTLTDTPIGDQVVTWTRERSQFVLTGPLPPEDLLRLAKTAKIEP